MSRRRSVRDPAHRSGPGAGLLMVLVVLVHACSDVPVREHPPVPEPDLSGMESRVEKRFRERRRAIENAPSSAEAWGRFGMVAHAHELWTEADIAYREARLLDDSEVRWPYYLGDVLFAAGTDLEGAAAAFRRALELRPGYAQTHLRLGRVLQAAGESAAAASELERALALHPDLVPAQVTLAQVRLAEGELDGAAALLEAVLEKEARHGQALSTLGQVYGRLGRRDEAREIAERARAPAVFNLYSDELMGEVVAEGVSSALVWDRAKAFFEQGNYRQAVLGLREVIEAQPDNVEVHEQLAVAYGHLDDAERSRPHLERVIELDPGNVDSRVRLATLHLGAGDGPAAIAPLEVALELSPEDPDVPWLLGRAHALSGDPGSAVTVFERAAAASEAAGRNVPGWARNEWGGALARAGRADAALEQFERALEVDPRDAQAAFYMGLVFEGQGRAEAAVERYCDSLRWQPDSPAAQRLAAQGRRCD